MKTASQMIPDRNYIIHAILDSSIQVNFLEIGIIAGRPIKLLQQAPLSGSMAFEVGGNLIAMRQSEAKLIQVVEEIDN